MATIFVDTSGFYAVADTRDRHHATAAAHFTARAAAGECVTSDYVFVETWCLLRARLGRDAALRFWDALSGGAVRVLGVGSDDVARARRIVRDWADQDFSLIDATSFALMERHRVDEALACDAHFRVFRTGPRRQHAFAVWP